jgi:aquaporin Z
MSVLTRKLTIEFIGTFLLVFTIGMAVHSAGALAPLAIGAVIMVLVFAGGHISGGHYNPAISLAVFARGKLTGREYGAYAVVQVVGAILAGLLIKALAYAPAAAAPVASQGRMLIVEFLFTFLLCFVVLNVATSKDTENNSFYGLAIGFTVAAGAFAVGPISGGVFNPAVAFGGSVLGMLTWSNLWVYLLAQLIGGAVAAGVFLLTQLPREEPAGRERAVETEGQVPRTVQPGGVSPAST